MSDRSPGDHQPGKGEAARSAVEAVLRDQAERQKRRDDVEHPRPKDRGPLLNVVAVVLAGLTVWFWLAPPSLLRPPPAPPPPPRVDQAALRMTVYTAVLRVERFRDSAQVVPTGLAQVFEGPEDMEGLTYERLGPQRFRLTGARGEHVVIYESGDSVSALLGDARQVLQGPRS